MDFYKYIGYVVVGLVFFYLAVKSIRFQVGVLEGLCNRKSNANEVAQAEQ